jgi:hypothetical protein
MRMRSTVLLSVFVMLLWSALAICQKPEYEFYFEFRKDLSQKLQEANSFSLTKERVLEKYAAKLKTEGIGESEIERRLGLRQTERAALEADFYSRHYLDQNSDFNRAPNHFIMETVKGRRPGVALDYGMGQGRNARYFASIGWQVWGFDPAEAGVEIARKQANELGLTLHTFAVPDSEFNFGKERFDLVPFSWTMPLIPIQKIVDSLKPGGIAVIVCGMQFNPSPNSILHI